MSIPSPEISTSISCKGDNETSCTDNGKDKRYLKKPSPVPVAQKMKAKTKIGLRSVSKTETTENGSIQKSASKSLSKASSIGNNGSRFARASSVSSASSSSQRRVFENQYLTKKNRYNTLRRELENKHKVVAEMHREISQLRDKVIAMGSKDPGKPEDIGLSLYSEKDKCLNHKIDNEIEESIDIPECEVDSEFMKNLKFKLQMILETYITLCKEALSERMDIVSWLMDFGHEECDNDSGLNEKIKIFRSEEDDFIEKLEHTNKIQCQAIVDMTNKFESLWGECQSYRSKFKNFRSTEEQNLLEEKVNNLSDLLEIERGKSQKMKERKTLLENQMQKLKTKVKELEDQVTNGESKINNLQNTVKQLESQVKQKESSLEQRTREVQKMSKINENVISKLEKQKEMLQSRLDKVTNELSNKDNANDAVRKTLQHLEENLKEFEQEKQLRLQGEDKIAELKEHYAALETKNKSLLQLLEKANLAPQESDNEKKLCKELQNAKMTIEKQEEKIDVLQREREHLVASLKRTSGHETSEEKVNKQMEELLKTTSELRNLKDENLQLKKNLKLAINKGESVQKQLAELHTRLQKQCNESGKADWSAVIVELQQQNSDLKCTLNDFARQNKKLETELSQKQVELECVQNNQSKIFKAREEMKNNNKSLKVIEKKKEGRDLKQVS